MPASEKRAKEKPMLNDATATLDELKAVMRRFVEERSWQPFHNPKNLSASIAIEAAELMEHFQWMPSHESLNIERPSDKMEAVEDELADVFAYVLSFADSLGIDLASSFLKKMAKNAGKYPAAEFKGRYE